VYEDIVVAFKVVLRQNASKGSPYIDLWRPSNDVVRSSVRSFLMMMQFFQRLQRLIRVISFNGLNIALFRCIGESTFS
jgi:hypothetical protein